MTQTLPNGSCPAADHPQESLRIKALHDFEVLDTLAEPMFDDIAQLASHICGTPIALISLVDSERQWFKAKVGLDAPETPREMAFCAHAILDPNEVFVVGNTLEDSRFATNPLVTGSPDIRFYAGAPIVTPEGLPIGTVCAIDRQPRQITVEQTQALQTLSRQVARMLTFRKASLARIVAVEGQLQVQADEAKRLMSFASLDLDLKAFVDRHYNFVAVNASYLAYWGRDVGAVVGKALAEVRGNAYFEQTLKPHIDRALQGEQSWFEAGVIYPTKGLRRMQITFVPVRSDQGDVVGVVINEHDIQELAQAAHRLRETITALEHKTLSQQKFIYMLSHDLREPVNTIINFSGVLEKKLGLAGDADMQRFASFVHGGGTRLKELLDDLLEYVRLEQQAVRSQPVSMNKIASQVVSDLADAIERSGAVVHCGDLPDLEGDPNLLRVVIQNLVANGIKFVPRDVKPEIHVSASDLGERVRIQVQDNGIGIDQAHSSQLFQLFKRLNNRKDYDGVGMGLATCRRIVEMHGGTIGVDSQLGQGSCFWMELPKQLPQAQADLVDSKAVA